MKKAEILCALTLLAGAGLMARESMRLVVGWGPSGPGAGFLPFWLSLGLALCALLVLADNLRKGARERGRFIREAAMPSLLKVLLPILGMLLVMEVAGFYVAAALYLGFSMRWIGRYGWFLVISVSLVIPLAVYLLVERWFLVLLPKGYLEIPMPF